MFSQCFILNIFLSCLSKTAWPAPAHQGSSNLLALAVRPGVCTGAQAAVLSTQLLSYAYPDGARESKQEGEGRAAGTGGLQGLKRASPSVPEVEAAAVPLVSRQQPVGSRKMPSSWAKISKPLAGLHLLRGNAGGLQRSLLQAWSNWWATKPHHNDFTS